LLPMRIFSALEVDLIWHFRISQQDFKVVVPRAPICNEVSSKARITFTSDLDHWKSLTKTQVRWRIGKKKIKGRGKGRRKVEGDG